MEEMSSKQAMEFGLYLIFDMSCARDNAEYPWEVRLEHNFRAAHRAWLEMQRASNHPQSIKIFKHVEGT